MAQNTPAFLRIPFDIREKVYRLLLTTPKRTTLEPTTLTLEFHLQPAILGVNKQIHAEATTILYQKNHFVILDVTGDRLALQKIPKFSLLSKDKITDPVLRVGVAVADQTLVDFVDRETVVTTLEGLDTIIHSLWTLEAHQNVALGSQLFHGDVELTLNYNPTAKDRPASLSELLLKPFEQISGFKKLILIGKIEDDLCNSPAKKIIRGPLLQAAGYLAIFHFEAERAFAKEDYDAARWWTTILHEYWTYLMHVRAARLGGLPLYSSGSELWATLRQRIPDYFEGRLKLVKAYLHERRYSEAAVCAQQVLAEITQDNGWAWQSGYRLHYSIENKFHKTISLERLSNIPTSSSSVRAATLLDEILQDPEPEQLKMFYVLR